MREIEKCALEVSTHPKGGIGDRSDTADEVFADAVGQAFLAVTRRRYPAFRWTLARPESEGVEGGTA